MAGDEFAGPVLGLGHEGALELLFVLPRCFLLLLLGVVRRQLWLLAAAHERASPPCQHHHKPRDECEDRRQEKAPPFSDTEAFIIRRGHGSAVFLGRSHSPRARGIQSDVQSPCTCNARARTPCSRATAAEAPPRVPAAAAPGAWSMPRDRSAHASAATVTQRPTSTCCTCKRLVLSQLLQPRLVTGYPRCCLQVVACGSHNPHSDTAIALVADL